MQILYALICLRRYKSKHINNNRWEDNIMPTTKVLFINSVCGYGSTGRIVVDLANNNEYEILICYGRNKNFSSKTNVYRIGSKLDTVISMCRTIFF